MDTDHDKVNAALNAYIDYLNAGAEGDAPSLHHLNPGERAETEAVIANMAGGREFDPTVSAPSLETLLHDTPYFEGLGTEPDAETDLDTVRRRVEELFPWRVHVDIEDDNAFGPRFLIVVNGQRIRAQIRRDAQSPAGLRASELIASAAAVYIEEPDTVGFALIHSDARLSSVIVDPFDPEQCIEVPSGDLVGPRPRRPILPLADAIRGYMDETFPLFDPIDIPNAGSFQDLGVASLDVEQIARRHVGRVAESGGRARTEAKRLAWTGLTEVEISALSDLLQSAYSGEVGSDGLGRWLNSLTADLP